MAMVLMIVTCAKRNRCAWWRRWGEKGPAELQGSCLLVLPNAASWFVTSVPELDLVTCCPNTPPQNPIPSSNLPAQGGHPMLASV